MAQHDMNIANQGFPATRADLNNALQAIATNNSGTSEPSTTFANQWFYNESTNKLFIRNEANNAFIEVATLDQTNGEWQITTGTIQAKDSDGLALKTDDGTTRLLVNDSGIVTVSSGLDLGTTTDAASVSTTPSDYQLQLGAAQSTTGDIGRNISFDFSGTTTAAINTVDGGTGTKQSLGFFTHSGSALNEAMRIDNSGNVGIGTTSPSEKMTIQSGNLNFMGGTNDAQFIKFGDTGDDDIGSIFYFHGNNNMVFTTNTSEAMRIDSSGNLLVGKTTSGTANTGAELRDGSSNHAVIATSTSEVPLVVNRKTSDGSCINILKDGSTVGTISTVSGDIAIFSTANNHSGWRFGSKQLLPTNNTGTIIDNDVDLGDPSFRFDDIFATNGTIQTSDENEKQNIASLTSAEITAATAISKLFKTFKWKDKVASKGDNARTHTGVVAQQVQTAMSDAGLDASKYAFWCSDTWWEKDVEVAAVEAVEAKDAVYDDDGNLVSEAVEGIEAQDAYTRTDHYDTKDEAPKGATERTRLGVRYPELLAFIGAATEQRLTSIEARLNALEG